MAPTARRSFGTPSRIGLVGVLSLLLTTTLSAAPSRGMVLQQPGWIRAWSLTGPLAPDTSTADAVVPTSSVLETNSNGVLDFNDRFKIRGPGSPTIIASGSLELSKDIDGWFLVKAEGWLAISIDGQQRYRRSAPLGRARGWEAVPLRLKSGNHVVRLECKRLNDRWSLAARFIDNSGQVPPGTVWHLPQTKAANASLAPFDVTVELGVNDPAGLRARIDARLGTPVKSGSPLTIQLSRADGTPIRLLKVGTWPRTDSSEGSLVVQLGLLSEWARILEKPENGLLLDATAGGWHVRRKLNLAHDVLQAWQSAVDIMHSLDRMPSEPLDVSRATVELAVNELSAIASGDKTNFEVHRAAASVQEICNSMEHGSVPWLLPGDHELGFRASADSSLQPFALYVPKPTETKSPVPLVVVLHGYNGTGQRVLDAFLDAVPGKPLPAVNGFLLAPAAHGNTFYRGPGERDVLEILDWALQALPVDGNRVTITGVSMGGTGTAEIALHYPDRFAAHSPLCGYHSYYVRRDTSGQPIRTWEKRLMHRNSSASSADSGRHLPMYLAHGLKDMPLENSKILTSRYKTLGYRMIEDWPNLGHSVWKKTWAHAGLFPWLSEQTRVTDPSRVTISATALRHSRNRWVTLTALESQAELSQIDVDATASNEVHVRSKGVLAFEVGETHHIDRAHSVRFDIDGNTLDAAPQSKLAFRRVNGTWIQGSLPEGRRKRPGAEGPWLDLWSEPLVFVYGTKNPATVGVNLEVARAFATSQGSNDVMYPVLSDVEYADSSPSGATAILVGNSSDHRWLERWASQLPIATDGQTLKFAGREFKGDRVGAIYIYPHPENPLQVVGVITAPTALGLWQSLSLPILLPDFLVFDSRTTSANGEPVLGKTARVLSAGFFENDWSLPAQLNDPIDQSMQ